MEKRGGRMRARDNTTVHSSVLCEVLGLCGMENLYPDAQPGSAPVLDAGSNLVKQGGNFEHAQHPQQTEHAKETEERQISVAVRDEQIDEFNLRRSSVGTAFILRYESLHSQTRRPKRFVSLKSSTHRDRARHVDPKPPTQLKITSVMNANVIPTSRNHITPSASLEKHTRKGTETAE
eukprot:1383256-Prymnesium_polylepis.2